MENGKEKQVRDAFNKLFEENKNIESVYKKVRNGTATYTEAHAFADEVGTILAKVFDLHIDAAELDETALYIVENMLTQNVRLTAAVCEGVQDNLNAVAGVGLKPKAPNAAALSDRVKRTVQGVVDVPTKDNAAAMLSSNAKTLTLAVVDNWVKTNAEFQAKAGLNPVIVRTWDGVRGSHDTQHTDKCAEWAGVFEYGTEPKEVYIRHRGCGCMVTYYPDKASKGRITALAKGEKDKAGVLWNTGLERSQSRDAILRRRRKQYGKDVARQMLNEEWRGGLNGNAERHFT